MVGEKHCSWRLALLDMKRWALGLIFEVGRAVGA